MVSNLSKFKEELEKLVGEAELLRFRMALDLGLVSEKERKELKDINPPSFKNNYERWYSLSLRVVKQLLPDRLDDFIKLYKDEKRKKVDYLTYGVADYMIGVRSTQGHTVIVNVDAAFPKFEQQINILKSAQSRLESALYDMTEIMQASVFDSELEQAKGLNDKGFFRAAGAIAGVVLERHLRIVCDKHKINIVKSKATINNLNQALKDSGSIDTATWRFIQHLADIRNLCDHSDTREPNREQIEDLIVGVAKITKTLV